MVDYTDYYGYKVKNYFSDYPHYDFTDHTGKTASIHQLWTYDPVALEAFGLRTVKDVFVWWLNNRKLDSELRGDKDYTLWDGVSRYFSALDYSATYEDFKRDYYWYLTEPVVRVQLSATQPTNEFHLVTPLDGESQDTIYSFWSFGDRGGVVIKPDQGEAQASDHWDRFYNYSHKMNPDQFNFFRKIKNESAPMFGMELELSTKLSHTEIQHIVREVEPKQEPFFIMKPDGSVNGKYHNKIELVTVPCSPKYLRTQWKTFFSKLNNLCVLKGKTIGDYFDMSDTLNNGIHIHVDREAFSSELTINKFLTVFNTHTEKALNFINQVARRPRILGAQYCAPCPDYEGRTLGYKLKGRPKGSALRYNTCHDTNRKTVEVRVFQGIVDIDHIMRCISFTEAMFQFCEEQGFTGFGVRFTDRFKSFIKEHKKYASIWDLEKCA